MASAAIVAVARCGNPLPCNQLVGKPLVSFDRFISLPRPELLMQRWPAVS